MIKSPAKPTALHSGPTRGTVPRPARRVVVKLLLSVVLIELIVMPIVGVVYYERFSAQIDSRYSERLETATALISRNRLNLTSLTDRETMSLLLGADLVDAMVITDQGLIAFSLDPAYRKKSIEAVDFLKGIVFDHDNTRPVLKRIQVGGHPYFVSLAALRGSGEHRVSSFLYFRVSEASAQREKANVALLLVLGLALTAMAMAMAMAMATSLALVQVSGRTILTRVTRLAQAVIKAQAGDLSVRTSTGAARRSRPDEIDILNEGFDTMVERLETLVGDLESRVADRTRDLALAKEAAESAQQRAEAAGLAKDHVHVDDEPRAALTAERHPRLRADPAARQEHERAGIERPEHHPPVGRPPAHADQRHPRHVESRSRPHGAVPGAGAAGRVPACRGHDRQRARRAEEPGVQDRCRRQPPAERADGRQAHAPGVAQPAQQCGEVHRRGRYDLPRQPGRPGQPIGHAEVRDHRHRCRHERGATEPAVPPLRTSGLVQAPPRARGRRPRLQPRLADRPLQLARLRGRRRGQRRAGPGPGSERAARPGADGRLDAGDGRRRGDEALRAAPRLANIPVLAITASPSPAERERMMAAGANGFLPKPIDPSALLSEVQRLLGVTWAFDSA